MQTKIIEASNGFNWGKFMLARPDAEWAQTSHLHEVAPWPGHEATLERSLLETCGWGREHLWVLDLQTGEGAYLRPGPHRSAHADLDKHRVWVCPMFAPFLTWLYDQDLADLAALPDAVEVAGESSFAGHRRTGSAPGEVAQRRSDVG